MKTKKKYARPVIQVYEGSIEPYLLAGSLDDTSGTIPPTKPGEDDGPQGPYADSKRSYFDVESNN